MAKSRNPKLGKDLLSRLDPDIVEVEYDPYGFLRMMLSSGERLSFDETDLSILLNFIRRNENGT